MNKDIKLYITIFLLIAIIFGQIIAPRTTIIYNEKSELKNYSDTTPSCPSCYFDAGIPEKAYEGTLLTLIINNLTINNSYLLTIQNDIIMFIAVLETQYIVVNIIAWQEFTFTFRLYELYINPFMFQVSDIMNNLGLLDEFQITIVSVNV